MNEFFENIGLINNSNISAKQYSPLVLAYIGDAVFEICVRTLVAGNLNAPVNKLHKESKKYVNASAQSEMFYRIKENLTEQEFAVLKRGRNAKSYTSAKNASVSDYRHATGLETLFGYLYLNKEYKRIIEIFNMCICTQDKNNEEN